MSHEYTGALITTHTSGYSCWRPDTALVGSISSCPGAAMRSMSWVLLASGIPSTYLFANTAELSVTSPKTQKYVTHRTSTASLHSQLSAYWLRRLREVPPWAKHSSVLELVDGLMRYVRCTTMLLFVWLKLHTRQTE